MRVPAIPNSPLLHATDPDPTGEMQLRRNTCLNFMENWAFDPEVAVYDGRYQNSQAHSARFLDHMGHVQALVEAQVSKGARIVEVGCGKGAFLEMLAATGRYDVTGYDATYEGNNPAIAKRYLGGDDRIDADFVVLRHVLEHIQAPHRFLAMLAQVFGPVPIYIEVPNADWIFENQTFFDITYEHVNYFSQAALAALFDGPPIAADLIFDGQYQYIVGNLGRVSPAFGAAYDAPDHWETLRFATLFPGLEAEISALAGRAGGGRRLYLWGAATKGCMFLVHAHAAGFCDVRAVVDINPDKVGKVLPLSHVPIWAPETFFADVRAGDSLMVMNPTYLSEIKAQIAGQGITGLDIFAFGSPGR